MLHEFDCGTCSQVPIPIPVLKYSNISNNHNDYYNKNDNKSDDNNNHNTS